MVFQDEIITHQNYEILLNVMHYPDYSSETGASRNNKVFVVWYNEDINQVDLYLDAAI
jgi:hypothetical protein